MAIERRELMKTGVSVVTRWLASDPSFGSAETRFHRRGLLSEALRAAYLFSSHLLPVLRTDVPRRNRHAELDPREGFVISLQGQSHGSVSLRWASVSGRVG